ncbi:hypothetical protein [Paraburkholderia piptadeniae]|nr:hypothetical protein [Paraburkholderia piptadeniae]
MAVADRRDGHWLERASDEVTVAWVIANKTTSAVELRAEALQSPPDR